MSWIYLLIAGIFEVVWSTAMKLSNGFSVLLYSVITVIGMIISFGSLVLATKSLPLSLAYPIWTGIGAVGSVIVGGNIQETLSEYYNQAEIAAKAKLNDTRLSDVIDTILVKQKEKEYLQKQQNYE